MRPHAETQQYAHAGSIQKVASVSTANEALTQRKHPALITCFVASGAIKVAHHRRCLGRKYILSLALHYSSGERLSQWQRRTCKLLTSSVDKPPASMQEEDRTAALDVLSLPDILTGIVEQLSRHEALKVRFDGTRI